MLYISQFQGLLSQYGLTNIEQLVAAQVAAIGSLSVVEPAEPPSRAIIPTTKTDALLSGSVGFVLSALLVVGIERLDDRVKSPSRLQELVHQPFLGAVSRRRTRRESAETADIDVGRFADEGWSEQFAFLYTNVEFALLGSGDQKSVLITSPRPRDGKTTVAYNLARAAAAAGGRVVLVDLDLRAPSVHRLLDIGPRPGFTNYVLGNASLGEVLAPTDDPNLEIVTAGSVPPHAIAVLRSRKVKDFVEEVKEHADFVIFDSPPCLVAPDSLLIGGFADATVLVANASATRRGMLRESLKALTHGGVNVCGVVLNYATERSESYYSYDYATQRGGDAKRKSSRSTNVVRRAINRVTSRNN